MSFRFRLERVLQHRQRRVDACGREVAQAERSARAADASVAVAAAAIREHDASVAGQGHPVALERARGVAWRDHLVSRRRLAEADLAVARDRLTAARSALQEAWRDREVLIRLRERQQQQWRDDLARRQQKELDEVGSIRAAIAAAANDAGARLRNADGKRAS